MAVVNFYLIIKSLTSYPLPVKVFFSSALATAYFTNAIWGTKIEEEEGF
jgi:hypothetical protein